LSTATFDVLDLPHLGSRHSSHRHVRHASYQATATFPSTHLLESAILFLFNNLTSLTFVGSPSAPETVLSHTFSNGLRHLKQLRRLGMAWTKPFRFEDDSFSIGKDIPQVVEVAISSQCASMSRLLRSPLVNVKNLRLVGYDASVLPYSLVPWTTLNSFEVYMWLFADMNEQQVLNLCESLEGAHTAQNVRTLSPCSLPFL
jgi:hypothetical protein